MRLKHILLLTLVVLTACDDTFSSMEWVNKDSSVTISDIPLELAEKIANYDYIKTYAAEYTPGMTIGVGLGADEYIAGADYRQVCDDNFQLFVTGNAMKHQEVVTNSGTMTFTTIDSWLSLVPADIDVYGHNFLWHTQQNQTYLKSLIAPTMTVATDQGGIANVLSGDASTFDGGTAGGWGSWGGDSYGVEDGEGVDGTPCMVLYKSSDGNAWDAQFAYTFTDPLTEGETYVIQFDAKSDTAAGQLQFQYQNGSTYGSQGGYNTFDVGTDWVTCEYEFTMAYADANRIILNFGAVAGTYYVDNIKFGVKIDDSSNAPRRKATTIYYTLKTADEKKAILLDAMESWIQGISEHIREQIGNRLVAWDVINEPITDNGYFRGIDNHFGGTDDDGIADSAPTETTDDGLDLHWANGAGNGHFYWGYYLGMDYATKAFEYARKYNPNALLFVNEYNLETSPSKMAKLIEFVNYIDQNGTVKVDGIGTQMHVTSTITDDEVRTMFSTLAATGKMIRVTELDVSIGTTSPSAEQLEEQANVYEMIVTAYKELIPEAQQSGITCWTLSDANDEHTYWLSGDSPNLFDANYQRKHAYKGFCDGLAGYDISTTFSGDDWKTAYDTSDNDTSEE